MVARKRVLIWLQAKTPVLKHRDCHIPCSNVGSNGLDSVTRTKLCCTWRRLYASVITHNPLSFPPIATNFSEIVIKISKFSLSKYSWHGFWKRYFVQNSTRKLRQLFTFVSMIAPIWPMSRPTTSPGKTNVFTDAPITAITLLSIR